MEKMKKTKLIFIIVFLILLLTACSGANTKEEPTPTPLPTPIIPTKPTYTVQRGEIINQLDFSGRIVPILEQKLAFENTGYVGDVKVKKGDQVTKGQVLAQLDVGNRESDLNRARIQVEMAKLGLELTKAQTSTYTKGYDLIIKLKEKEVELAELALQDLEKDVAASQIVSPMDGEIISIFLKEDELAEAFKPVITVADTTALEVSSEPSNSVLTDLMEGMEILVIPQVVEGDNINGTIRSLPYPYGKGGEDETSVRITLETDPLQAGYELGDMVKVIVVLERKDGVLWLPPQAIRTYEGRRFVVIEDENGRRRADVKIGIENQDMVEIIEGVTEGQTILAP